MFTLVHLECFRSRTVKIYRELVPYEINPYKIVQYFGLECCLPVAMQQFVKMYIFGNSAIDIKRNCIFGVAALNVKIDNHLGYKLPLHLTLRSVLVSSKMRKLIT